MGAKIRKRWYGPTLWIQTVAREENYLVDQKKIHSLGTHSTLLDVHGSSSNCDFVTLP